MITRRNFIRRTITALPGLPFLCSISPSTISKKLENFGFISGIIGKELKGDWKAVLREAASFGYTEIETGNFLGESAESYLSFLENIGIKLIAGGFEFRASDEDLKKSMELLKKLRAQYAVVYWPWYTGGPFSLDDCRKSAERLNQLGKICRDNGFNFCWHNHDKEFTPMENGLPFDFLMNNTDRDIVSCELDIYWIKKGGGDPLEVMKKYPGRYPLLHVKDMTPGDKMDFECPGSGIINFPLIFMEADKQGIKHFFVERDNVPDGIACLKSAAEYLKKVNY